MDVSPIQRLAIAANHAPLPAREPREVPAVPPAAQAKAPAADEQAAHPGRQASTRVVVSFHAASLGYVTRVVDQHTGAVVLQTPPQQVLDMVQQVIDKLEKANR
ncbi:MAG TPA: flagellar protein FlaG [Egibacteraceae bacterium]|nr:flagellar protein FlaG [Egibacteraceae bacterium]